MSGCVTLLYISIQPVCSIQPVSQHVLFHFLCRCQAEIAYLIQSTKASLTDTVAYLECQESRRTCLYFPVSISFTREQEIKTYIDNRDNI